MSFLNIKDSFKRDKTVKEYLTLKKRIKNRNLQEKAYDFANHEMIEESLEPVVRSNATSTEAITKELIPIKEQLEQLTKLVKPKAVKIGKKRPAEDDLEQFEVNQSAKKQDIDQQYLVLWRKIS